PHGRRVSCPATAGTGGRAWRVRRRGLPAPPSPWTASTTPAPSCPRTTGSGTGYTWSRTTRSVRHSPAATTRTSTSSSRGGSSTAVVSSNAPFSLTTAAVISLGAVIEAAIRIPTSAVLVQAPRHRGFAGGSDSRALPRLRRSKHSNPGAGRPRLSPPFVRRPGPPRRSAGSGRRRAPPTAPHSRPGRCGVRRRLRAAGPWSGSTAATGTDPATGTPARPDRGGTAPHPQAGRHRTLIGMLLWMSSGEFKMVWCGDELVELAGDVAFEAADDLLLGHAVFG